MDDKVKDYLKSQKIMSLATSDGKGNLWSANLYFVNDDANIYFMSAPDTLHSQFISVNKNVSLTVCDSSQDEISGKVGLQASGHSEHITDIQTLEKILEIWNKKFSKKQVDKKRIENNPLFYRIKLKKVKFFNTDLFEDKFKEWEL